MCVARRSPVTIVANGWARTSVRAVATLSSRNASWMCTIASYPSGREASRSAVLVPSAVAVPGAQRAQVAGADLGPAQRAAGVARGGPGAAVALRVEPPRRRQPVATEHLGIAEHGGVDVGRVAMRDRALADVDHVDAAVEREGRAHVLLGERVGARGRERDAVGVLE